MEIIKVKCLNCMEITSIVRELLIPYSGKAVSIKCSNPKCGLPMKVQVPAFNAGSEIKLPEPVPELPPTQVIINQQRKTSGARLKIQKNDKTEEQTFFLKVGLNTVGRHSLQLNEFVPDIPINSTDKKISRNHCEINLIMKDRNFEALLKDNKSTNGTFISGTNEAMKPGDEIYLNNGDIFIIGETKIQIEFE